MHRRRVTSVPERPFATHNSSTNCPISHRPRPARGRHGSGVGCGDGPVADRRLDPAGLQPDGHPDRLMSQDPHRMALVTASLTASTTSSTTTSPRAGGQQSCCKLVGRRAEARQGSSAMPQGDFQLSPATGVAAVMVWWRVLQARVVQLRHRDGRGGGVAPAQPRPAAAPANRHRQGPLRLGQCRPSSSPWPATAGPAPPPAAQCRAPDTAGRRGCRTAARGRGTPGSANRRSAECTDGRRRAWASTCSCGPCRSPSRARW